jgi:hypothetical protein
VAIKQRLAPFYPASFLDSVRYTTAWNTILPSVQSIALGNTDAVAITLAADIIVFKNVGDAENSVSLWAHELEHARQYVALGTDGFAQMYLYEAGEVEGAAEKQTRCVCTTLGITNCVGGG